jgi:hypothetical protein
MPKSMLYKVLLGNLFLLLTFIYFVRVNAGENSSNPLSDRIDRVLIHMRNTPEGNKNFPGSNGLVMIQRGRFRQNGETLDGMASFHNIPSRSNYTVTAMNKSKSRAFNEVMELWGRWNNVSISSEKPELTFTREMPFIWDIRSFHARRNSVNPSLEAGEPITFEIILRNPSSQRLKSRIVLLLKNIDTADVSSLEKEVTLEPNENHRQVLLNYVPKEAGEYHFAPGIFVRQGINHWTDCWDWSEEPLFYVTGAHRTLEFAGYKWDVKAGFGNPGNNLWSNDTNQVRVDENGRLHLKLQKKRNRWYASEVISQDFFGYGTYTFYIEGEPSEFDPHVVAGIFLYHDEKNEIDIEFSRWGDADNYQFGNYVLQPAEFPGNQFRFPVFTTGSFTSHRIVWKPDEVLFSSWHGHHPDPPEGQIIAQWQYAGRYIPINLQLRLFFNIWLFQGIQPKQDKTEKLIISNFTFEPLEE